jgi:hypothetical protein
MRAAVNPAGGTLKIIINKLVGNGDRVVSGF